MLQNDVLENGTFKPPPKLAESSSKHASWHQSQLVGLMVEQWMDGEAAWPKV